MKLIGIFLLTLGALLAQTVTPQGAIIRMSDGTYRIYSFEDLAALLPPPPAGPAGPPGPAGPAGMAWRGIWDDTTLYNERDGVMGREGNTWIAIVPHPTVGLLPTDDPLEWSMTATRGFDGPTGMNWRGAWQTTAQYTLHDAVIDPLGSAYISIVLLPKIGAMPADDTAEWSMLASRGLQGMQGNAGPAGAQGVPGLGWPGPQGVKGDRGDRGDVGAGVSWRGGWFTDVKYKIGDLVFWNSCTWIAIVDTPADQLSQVPGASEGPQWALFAGGNMQSLLLPPGVPH